MRNPKRNSAESEEMSDPLDKELDFSKLTPVKLGPGWSKVPKRLRSLKHLREARAWLKRHEDHSSESREANR
jgi:hypothetical protein